MSGHLPRILPFGASEPRNARAVETAALRLQQTLDQRGELLGRIATMRGFIAKAERDIEGLQREIGVLLDQVAAAETDAAKCAAELGKVATTATTFAEVQP